VVKALVASHPYEEVAYDIFTMDNMHFGIGSGIVGTLEQPVEEKAFLERLRDVFQLNVLKHTALLGKPVQKVAFCGGAGSFLVQAAIRSNADIYITADLKYHEFFDADGRLVLADIGHYESEQFTIDLLYDLLVKNFPTFAVLKTGVNTNPVSYFTGI
jgi:putative NIF3 family GTP cyclohydrolase 1 type 2